MCTASGRVMTPLEQEEDDDSTRSYSVRSNASNARGISGSMALYSLLEKGTFWNQLVWMS